MHSIPFSTRQWAYTPFRHSAKCWPRLGYDGITVAAWGGTPLTDLSLLPSVRENHGLHIEGLYLVLHEGRNDALIRRIVETRRRSRADRTGDSNLSQWQPKPFSRFIESLQPIAERRGLRIALYPHLHHVTQTTTQIVQICELFAHPRLGASFNGYHWYASQEGELEQRLCAMKPWLMQVVTSGSALSQLGWGGVATMEPVDRGEMDNFALIAALNRVGYTGSIGVLGWDYGGDITSSSSAAWKRCVKSINAWNVTRRWSDFPLK